MSGNRNDLACPEGLDAKGAKAHKVIVDFLQRKGLTETGGCRAFYSPEAWKERGEQYGLRSLLIVVYDGGDLRQAFNMDSGYNAGSYTMLEQMQNELRAIGCFAEECTGWYAAIYEE